MQRLSVICCALGRERKEREGVCSLIQIMTDHMFLFRITALQNLLSGSSKLLERGGDASSKAHHELVVRLDKTQCKTT